MLDKRMEWTVRRIDARKNVLQSFFSAPTLALALEQAEEWKEFYGQRVKIKIQRRLVANFTEV